ncbi:hypothetical protein FNU76_15670 [Chitinimonas arctica]|uniref:Uncharacterized protein n=1 Tax=Chitinimonas arctica TaxID=2594795 RepID=A0A516SHN3_9NEIS|nr:hypothetical protein [Chitinimonas arctica]QDQ27671.1 hypothetical protein FNU76_15670 [Chitinimonas arctica]
MKVTIMSKHTNSSQQDFSRTAQAFGPSSGAVLYTETGAGTAPVRSLTALSTDRPEQGALLLKLDLEKGAWALGLSHGQIGFLRPVLRKYADHARREYVGEILEMDYPLPAPEDDMLLSTPYAVEDIFSEIGSDDRLHLTLSGGTLPKELAICMTLSQGDQLLRYIEARTA